jgi:hypothetical protein
LRRYFRLRCVGLLTVEILYTRVVVADCLSQRQWVEQPSLFQTALG